MGAGNLAPHDSDLGAADLLGGAVDEGDLLAAVEGGGLGVVDTLNLDQAGVGVGVALASLVAEMTSPVQGRSVRCLCGVACLCMWANRDIMEISFGLYIEMGSFEHAAIKTGVIEWQFRLIVTHLT
jgi:hypothetical protein